MKKIIITAAVLAVTATSAVMLYPNEEQQDAPKMQMNTSVVEPTEPEIVQEAAPEPVLAPVEEEVVNVPIIKEEPVIEAPRPLREDELFDTYYFKVLDKENSLNPRIHFVSLNSFIRIGWAVNPNKFTTGNVDYIIDTCADQRLEYVMNIYTDKRADYVHYCRP